MNNRILFKVSMAMLLSCGITVSSIAQEDNESEKSIERIEVYGEKPYIYYVRQFRQRQREYYDLLNQAIDEPEMKIKCESEETQLGSRFRQVLCQPRYVKLIKGEEYQKSLGRSGDFSALGALRAGRSAAKINSRIELKNEELAKKLDQLMLSDDKLWGKFQELQAAKEALDIKRSGGKASR